MRSIDELTERAKVGRVVELSDAPGCALPLVAQRSALVLNVRDRCGPGSPAGGCTLGHANLGITSVYLEGIDNAEIIDAVHARRPPTLPATAGNRSSSSTR